MGQGKAFRRNHFFSALFANLGNSLLKQQNNAKNHSESFLSIQSEVDLSSSTNHLQNLQDAREQIMNSFHDLVVILESFHEVYVREKKEKSMLCAHYQKQAIQYAISFIEKTEQNLHNFNLPFEMMGNSEAYQLFKTLHLLKSYQYELPSGWYQSVKFLLSDISQASHYYQKLRKENSEDYLN
jgi:hypothetical protein